MLADARSELHRCPDPESAAKKLLAGEVPDGSTVKVDEGELKFAMN